MKRLALCGVLALSTLWFSAPARAQLPPPLRAAASTFTAGTLRVAVYGTPRKPAMIFIPGLLCGPWEWSGEIARYSPDYTIYALTLPGFDGAPPAAGDLFKTVSADFWTMLQTHGIEKPVLVGHSLGGTLGIMLAEQHPELLRGIVAVDGLPIFPGFERMTAAQRAQAAQRFGAMLASASTPQQFEFAEKTYALPALMSSPSDIAAVAPLVAKSDPQAAGAWAAQDTMLDLRPELAAATVPLLEVAPFDPSAETQFSGGAAKVRAYYRSLLAGDAHASVVVVSPSRHFAMYDRPQQLDAAIDGFLRTLR